MDLNATTSTDTINGATDATETVATTLNNGTLNVQGAGAVTLDGISATGTSSITNENTNATTSLGGITLTNATANVTGVKAANHTGFTFVGDNTLNSNNSDLEDISVATGQTVTVNSTGATTYTSANVQGTLDLNATTDADTIDGTATSLNNGTLNVQGAGAVTLDGISATGTSSITNANTNYATDLGNITMNGDVSLTLNNLASNNNILLNGVENKRLTLDNSNFNSVAISAGQTLDINSVNNSSVVASASLTGADANSANLNLKADSADLTLNALQVNGYSNVDITDVDGFATSIGDIEVQATNNAITNSSNAQVSLGDITFADGINNALNLSGAQGFDVDTITSGGTDVINIENASVDSIVVNAADNLQINGNMSYGSADVNGTLGLNATDAADAIISSGTTALNDASLNLAGSGAVQLDAVTATGTNTISNNVASAYISDATVSADSSLDINASSDIGFDNVVLNQSAVATDSLNLNANGGDIVVNSLNMNGNNNATARGANNIQISDLVANGLNNNFDNSNSGVVSINTVELNAGSSLALNGSFIDATNLNMHGGELTLDTGVSFTDTVIDGVNNHINIINNVVANTLGDVTLDNTSVILENVGSTNYDNLSVVGDNTVTLRSSSLKNVDLAAGQDLTIKTDDNSGNEYFGTVNMADSASLTLDAFAGTSLRANNINPSSVVMNGNNTLTTQGSGDIWISGISVEGQANTIDNTNVNTIWGPISMNDAQLYVSNLHLGRDVHQGTIYAALDLTGDNEIYSKDSSFGELNVPANSTLTLGTQAGSTTATTYTNANLIGENATDTNTLKLDASNAAIVGNNLKLETYSLGYGPANNSENIVEISGTNEVQLGDVSVTGIQNTISSTNTETTKIGDITFVNEPAVGNELTLQGNFENTGVITTASAADVLKTKGEIKLSGLAVGSTHNLAVNSTGGNTTFTTTAGIPTLADGATLTLNANGGSITADTTGSVISTSATGNSTLNIQGADAVILNGVNLSGENSLNVSNTNENTTLGDVNLGNGTLDTSNGVIDTVRVNNLTIADNSTWNLDVNATQKTADSISVAGQIAGSKLNFAIKNVVGDTTDKFVSYMKLIDSDDYVLNTTGDAGKRHVELVTGEGVYYSYVDKGAVDYDPEDGDYLANTVRVTNYNIDSDQLLDYVTRQGERTFRIGGGVQNVALTGITALPNLEAREGVNNILTLQDENGHEIIDGADAAQMFKIDTTDGIERTLNLQGLTFANAVTDAANGTPNGAVILTNSTDTAATVNLSSFESTNGIVNPLFKDNTATQDGGVIYNSGAASSVNSTSDANIIFKNNIAGRNGGAIANVNNATINFAGDTTFEENIAQGDGGAIYNDNATLKIGAADKTTKFTNNVATGSGGAVASVNNNMEYLGDVVFEGGAAGVNGGAISAIESTITLDGTQSFVNNAALGKGGAIYAKGSEANRAVINIASTRAGKSTVFEGNTANGDSNAIYLDGNATVGLSAVDDSSIIINDKIAGTAENNDLVQEAGSVYYNNDNSAYNGNFSLLAGDAYFTNPNSVAFMGGNYELYGGSTLHLTNGKLDTINVNTVDLSNTSADNAAKLAIDLNLKKNQEDSDKFILTTPSAGGNILVSEINVLNGENDKKFIPYDIIEGAEFASSMKEVETPYYYYNVKGRTSGLDLTRGRLADTGLMAPQVAVNARLAGQLDLYNQMLHRVDEIAEYRYFNKVNKNNLYASAYETIDNKYTPYVNQEDGGNAWMKPSVTLETVRPDSDGGVEKYKNRAYNTILGYETPISTLRNGWELINTVFGGYQGSFQQYDNIKNYQNGGVGGYMANLYKNNFFAGGVVSAGAIGVDTKDSGRYGRGMSFGLFDVGAAARVGYNVGMGKNWLFQPMFTTSYIYISGISKHNNRGEEMELDGTNTLLLSPGFKLIGNYNGWQPYALFDYTWPLIAKTVANVNNLELPDMQLRSYVEYGVGLRKNFGDKFTGYGEAVFRNIGRTGVTLQGGFVYKF